ncbi:TolB family protein [Streptomyces sp. NPDC057702]|uniref:TolB family protein n=1 Tax=unclassified Streptomyces TaxID=2593676 RepID=UPI00368AD1AC
MRRNRLRTSLVAVGLCALALPAAPALGSTVTGDRAPAGPGPLVERVSVTADGAQADGASGNAVISGDGHTVVFVSEATNLVPGTEHPGIQLYAKDLRTGRVDLVSAGADGRLATGLGGRHAVSADGRFVVFDAESALDARDTNPGPDVYLRDRRRGTTELVTTKDADAPAGRSFGASLSADGRYVSFTSLRADFGPKDTNGTGDVYVRDRRRGTTELASVATDGTQGDGASAESLLSPDGRQVTFTTTARTLFPWSEPPRAPRRPMPYITFGVRDRRAAQTTAGAYNLNGLPAKVSYEMAFSADSRYLLFQSGERIVSEGEPVDVWNTYARDLRTGTYRRLVLLPDGGVPRRAAYGLGLSPDNRIVYFTASDADFAPDDPHPAWDTYRRDLVTGEVTRLVSALDGRSPAGGSWGARPDQTGRSLSFVSESPDLVAGDTNGVSDVFVRRLR